MVVAVKYGSDTLVVALPRSGTEGSVVTLLGSIVALGRMLLDLLPVA